MRHRYALLAVAALGLAACDPAGPTTNRAGVYTIRAGDTARVQQTMLDGVNALRAGQGLTPLQLNAQLSSAAANHAREMSRQRRAWPFGADGSTPYDRVRAAGYSGELVAELYSQSFETESQTLSAWTQDSTWGAELLDPDVRDMGLGWRQDSNGLIWWAITLGDGSVVELPAATI